jgi:uncharacterized surface anchored protein
MRIRNFPSIILIALLGLALFVPATLAVQATPSPTPTTATKGSITVHKTNSGGADLPGADFSLYTDNGDNTFQAPPDVFVAGTSTTDASGKVVFADLAFATYWVVETKAPDGFAIADPIAVTIPDASQNVDVTVEIADQAATGSPSTAATATPAPTATPKASRAPRDTAIELFGPGETPPSMLILGGATLLLLLGLVMIVTTRRRASRS